jgi:ribose 5-phosphate isomerase A
MADRTYLFGGGRDGWPDKASMDSDRLKRLAAERALDFVKPGMKLGLGTGSTAAHFVELLGARVAAGLDIAGVPTSEATRALAERHGVPLITLDDHPELDLTIDGADEIDPELRLIKGGGGALLREKIVAMASERMIVIADRGKLVDRLGFYPLPVEIVQFGARATLRMVEAAAEDIGCVGRIGLRKAADGGNFISDGGNFIIDCAFDSILDPEGLGDVLEMIPGVIEHGLFIGIADTAILAGPEGVETIEARNG